MKEGFLKSFSGWVSKSVSIISLFGVLAACGEGQDDPTDIQNKLGASGQALVADACSRGAKITWVQGQWKSGPLENLVMDQTTGALEADGGDIFTGTFTGTSTYHVTGNLLPDGSFIGFSDETITATASDGTKGTIREAHQPLHIDAKGNMSEISPITSGTGAWAGSTGLLFYKGFVNPFDPSIPDQGGEYYGVWIRPQRKK